MGPLVKDHPKWLDKIISGGQTGVDRAALDVALELGITCGGWCPKGRRAEDGQIPERYPLKETAAKNYFTRTERNVRESDGTLVVAWGQPKAGTALTVRYAQKYKKPYWVIDLSMRGDPSTVKDWGKTNKVRVLNVAGPRESEAPGIHDRAVKFLREVLDGS